MDKKRIELTTIVELIEELKQLPPKTKVYVNGVYGGYIHIMSDENGKQSVSFDDDPLDELYESEE